MLAELSPGELAEWQAYLDGIGETDDQLNAASMTAAVVNETRQLRQELKEFMGSKEKLKPVRARDYLRRWRTGAKRSRRQTLDQITTILHGAMGG